MTEKSWGWTTGTDNDGTSTYTQTDYANQMAVIAATAGFEGVASSYLNKLAVTGTSSPVSINTGGAVVDGHPYKNDSAATLAIATPVTLTRIDRVVLRADWASHKVRITRIAGAEGGAAPAITQTSGTTYDIQLAQVSITTGGVITVTDERTFALVKTADITDANVTVAKMAANSVDSDQYVDGSIDLAHMSANSVDSDQYVDGSIDLAHMSANSVDSDQYVDGSIDQEHLSAGASKVANRQGGNATDWQTPGTTNYAPSGVRIQCGSVVVPSPLGVGNLVTVTFPVAFSGKPLVFCQRAVPSTLLAPGVFSPWLVYSDTLSTTAFSVLNEDIGAHSMFWIAIGPA